MRRKSIAILWQNATEGNLWSRTEIFAASFGTKKLKTHFIEIYV